MIIWVIVFTVEIINSRISIGVIRSGTAGHGAKTDICDVEGCSCEAERSLNMKQVAKCTLRLKNMDARNVHLCKEHYKQYKKETKTDRSIDSIY